MAFEGYDLLNIKLDRGVAFVTIDNPPINLFDVPLMLEIDRVGRELEASDDVRVVVFDSADPDFFIAHADVTMIEQLPDDDDERPTELNIFHALVDRFRTMPKATIGKIEGVARGGGSEFLLSLDMRFAALGKAVLSQPEVALGIIPGGSGTQRLPRLVGRGRALEIILGCDDFGAELAERYGYVNRAMAPDELGPFVERLAYRIAGFPAKAIAEAKRATIGGEPPVVDGLLGEAHCFNKTLGSEDARTRMRAFMEAGGQTRDVELGIGNLLESIAEPAKDTTDD
jgi:enoyl-CoA hydratase/carnithine racemase